MPSVTLGQIESMVYDRLDANTVWYTPAQITTIVNEFYRISNVACGTNQIQVAVPGFSVAYNLLYSVPSPILVPMIARFEGRELVRMSLESLARNYKSFATDNTIKNGPVARWSPLGLTQFIIHPMDAIGGRDIEITGVVEPVPLAAPGDVLQLDDQFTDVVVDYVVHRLQLKEGGKTFADSSRFIQDFYAMLKERKEYSQEKMPKYWILSGTTRLMQP